MLSAWEEFYRSCFSTFKMKRIDLSKNRWHWIKGKVWMHKAHNLHVEWKKKKKNKTRNEEKGKTTYKWKHKIFWPVSFYSRRKDLFIWLLIHNLLPSFLFVSSSSSFPLVKSFLFHRILPHFLIKFHISFGVLFFSSFFSVLIIFHFAFNFQVVKTKH